MKKINLIILFCFASASLIAQMELVSDRLDSLLIEFAAEHSIVGLSIGVVDQGYYSKSYGHLAFDSEELVTDKTMFNVASITKLFTACAIMQLVEQGKLSLDDKLVDVLPLFKMKDKRHRQITIEHLLTHSSGLMWDNKLENSPDDLSSRNLFLKQLERKRLKFKPGKKMSYATYSNVAFDLLGLVIEQVTGQNYNDYVRINILTKSQMQQSTFMFEQIDSFLLALPQIVAGDSKEIDLLNFAGVDRNKNPILSSGPLALKNHHTVGEDYEHNASGNLMSSTRELNFWISSILQDAVDNPGKNILEKESIQNMWTKRRDVPGRDVSIGLAWWIKHDAELGDGYFHVGTNPGYCAILMIYPEKNIGISILCNGWYAQEVVWGDLFDEVRNLYID